MRGPKPKSVEQKRLLGNPGKRALPAAGTLAVVPQTGLSPQHLDPHELLDRVLEMGGHWLAVTDEVVLSLLRQTLEERAQVRDGVMSGMAKRSELRELDKQVVSLLAQCGFDPASRARLGLAEVKAASKLEQIRRSQVADKGSAG